MEFFLGESRCCQLTQMGFPLDLEKIPNVLKLFWCNESVIKSIHPNVFLIISVMKLLEILREILPEVKLQEKLHQFPQKYF